MGSPSAGLPHEPARFFPEFQGASYLNRYDILCQKRVLENLYTVWLHFDFGTRGR